MKWKISALLIVLCLVLSSVLSSGTGGPPPGKPMIHEINIDDPAVWAANHPDTKVGLRRQDSVVWYSKKCFQISKIEPMTAGKGFPFYRLTPMKSIKGTDDIWRVSAGVARSDVIYDTKGEKYKITVQWLDENDVPVEEKDPHISIHPTI